MTPRTEEVFRQAMELTPDEREALVEKLGTVDQDPAALETAWLAEIERRAGSDPSEDIPWEDIRRKSFARLRKA